MGLLDYLTAHALDEDYAYASERRRPRGPRAGPQSGRESGPGSGGGRRGGRRPERRRVGLAGALVLALFGVLLVVAAARTSQGAAADAAQREDLAAQVSALRDRVSEERRSIRALQRETERLQAQQLASDDSATGLRQRVEGLGRLTGTLPVRGPGVVVVADDAPGSDSDRTTVLDSDLQRLVNGWWAAGAEAISINGQRLTTLSTIRLAGSAITVNARSLRPPYRLEVIGDPDTLPARFAESSSGRAWLDLQQQVGLQLDITPVEELRLSATEATLRFANQDDEQGVTP